jgi:hypothetical protein
VSSDRSTDEDQAGREPESALCDGYEYVVDSYGIEPVGRFRWGAGVALKRRGAEPANELIHLHEHFGATEEEARRKARAEAREWIAKRQQFR